MHTRELAGLTTLRMGGPAGVVTVTSQADLVAAVHDHPDARILGGGSNVVAGPAGVPEPVILVRTSGWTVTHGQVVVQAGVPWDEFVAEAIADGWSGVEALSGIPGSAGATPVQNVGAYGQDVAQTIAGMRVLDRLTSEVRTMPAPEAGFGYRSSRLKSGGGRFVVLAVAFDLRRDVVGPSVQYPQVAEALGCAVGDTTPSAAVREAVLDLRRAKGMVLDPNEPDAVSAGSFFTNPIVATAPEGAPTWPTPDGMVKTSAAWLIENSGIARGFRLPGSSAGVSGKHTLALVNRGGATADDLLTLARHIRGAVLERFGVLLEPEPVLWGCAL